MNGAGVRRFQSTVIWGGVLYTASECDDWLSGCEPGAGPVYVRTRKKLGFHYLQWKHLDDGICQGRRSTVPKRDISANLQTLTAYAPPSVETSAPPCFKLTRSN